jgi:hypothetical protein
MTGFFFYSGRSIASSVACAAAARLPSLNDDF